MQNMPLVSIVIRTCGRPAVLKKALDSVALQDYKNIEVVVVEDGSNMSEEMICSQYSDMNIKYISESRRVGRSAVGNRGMAAASGAYLNFLDDDDVFLPNHVGTLAKTIREHDCIAAYSIAEEHQFQKKDGLEYPYQVKRKFVRYKQPFNRLLLYYMNYIPIQSIMFRRDLFEKYGGFDETLDALEDWDMWVRYSLEGDFVFVPETTSVYYTPYKSTEKRKRDIAIKSKENELIEKHKKYYVNLSVEQINRDMDYILNVFNKKGIFFYVKKIRNYLLYRDL